MRRSRLFRGVCALVLVTFASTGSAQTTPAETANTEGAAPPAASSPSSPPAPPIPIPVVSPTPMASPKAVEISLVTDDSRVGLYAKETRKITVQDEVVDSWEFICKAPCNLRVEPNRVYRVMGDGILPSKDFNLAPGSGRVTLRVSPSSHGARVASGVIASVGSVLVASSALVLLFEVAARSAGDAVAAGDTAGNSTYGAAAQSQFDSTADTLEIVGITLLAVGVVSWISALAVYLSSNTGLDPVGPSQHASGSSGPRLIPGGFAF